MTSSIFCTTFTFVQCLLEPRNLIMVAFSGYSNFKKVTADSHSKERISCLDGLRVFSILWVILGHRFALQEGIPNVNADFVPEVSGAHNELSNCAHISIDRTTWYNTITRAMFYAKFFNS